MVSMVSSTASSFTVYPTPPLPNKRGPSLSIGGDLVVTYDSDLAQCEILLPAGSRYTNAGNFKEGTFYL